MAYRTVNLKPETYKRLAQYRVLGQSFDDVLRHLMDRVAPKSLHGEIVRKAARELEIPGAAEEAMVEFREMPRRDPGIKAVRAAPKSPTKAIAKAAVPKPAAKPLHKLAK